MSALLWLVWSGLVCTASLWSGLVCSRISSRLASLRHVACGRVGVASCRFQRCALPLNWGLIECPEALDDDDDDDGDDDDDTEAEAEKAEMEVTLTPFKRELRGCWKDTTLCCLRACVSPVSISHSCVCEYVCVSMCVCV